MKPEQHLQQLGDWAPYLYDSVLDFPWLEILQEMVRGWGGQHQHTSLGAYDKQRWGANLWEPPAKGHWNAQPVEVGILLKLHMQPEVFVQQYVLSFLPPLQLPSCIFLGLNLQFQLLWVLMIIYTLFAEAHSWFPCKHSCHVLNASSFFATASKTVGRMYGHFFKLLFWAWTFKKDSSCCIVQNLFRKFCMRNLHTPSLSDSPPYHHQNYLIFTKLWTQQPWAVRAVVMRWTPVMTSSLFMIKGLGFSSPFSNIVCMQWFKNKCIELRVLCKQVSQSGDYDDVDGNLCELVKNWNIWMQ